MWDIILDAIIDSLKMLPFLFGAYIIIEYVEHRASDRLQRALGRGGRFGAVGGALLGCFPQCGFSVAASNLYAGGLITSGTLIAVFLSTSDEAIPILLSNPGSFGVLVELIAIKIVISMCVGLIIDFFPKKLFAKSAPIQDHGKVHDDLCGHCGCNEHGVFPSALHHTVHTFGFILAVVLIMNTLLSIIGEAQLTSFLTTNSIFQPAIAALIGLIPNCAASIVLTELFLAGTISFGAVVSGLLSGAGIGLVVLFKTNKNIKQNIKITAVLYGVAVISGMAIQLVSR